MTTIYDKIATEGDLLSTGGYVFYLFCLTLVLELFKSEAFQTETVKNKTLTISFIYFVDLLYQNL